MQSTLLLISSLLLLTLLYFLVSRRQPRPRKGLHPAVVWSFPTARYGDVKQHKSITDGELECGVCVLELGDDERVRVLPHCSHAFHVECIDRFLQLSVRCPVCHADVSSPAAGRDLSGDCEDRHRLWIPVAGTPASGRRLYWRRSNGRWWV